jgi:hypothetical protein
MAVMAAGVHLALDGRFVRPRSEFRHGERVHVGAQPDATRAVADLQRADDACLGEAGGDLQPQRFELAGDDSGGARLLEAEFGMGMEVMPERRQEGQVGGDLVGNVHRTVWLG